MNTIQIADGSALETWPGDDADNKPPLKQDEQVTPGAAATYFNETKPLISHSPRHKLFGNVPAGLTAQQRKTALPVQE